MKVRSAVGIGHLLVTLPSSILMVTAAVVGRSLFSVVVGFVLAWLWWSYWVPRWRDWAHAAGLDPDALQKSAELTCLVWPRGSIFEKTEFRRARSRGKTA
jgi:TRAP-type C4-dicarboxylate transport system permease small subunit